MTERSDSIDNLDLQSLLTEEEFEETYEGASTHAPGEMVGSPIVEDDGTGNTNAATSSDPEVVTLRNVQSPEQCFGLHNENGTYSGKMVCFIEGVLITDRDTANRVLAVAPHVQEEPTEGPVFKHTSGFQTRSPEIFEAYTLRQASNLV